MLISYPLLSSASTVNDPFAPDAAWKPQALPKQDQSHQRVEAEPGKQTETDDSIFEKELIDQPTPVVLPATPLNKIDADTAEREAPHGVFPISADKRWHAGIHLSLDNTLEAIHAIADGVVVATLYPKTAIKDKADKECDNGFVLLRHDTEIGARLIPATKDQPAKLEPIQFSYFSLYMHLRNQTGERQAGISSHKDRPFIRPLIEPTPDVLQTFADPKTAPRVYRREIVGYPGKMYGHTQVHCEVFATDEQMQKLSDTEKLVAQGKSSDRLPWGKLYFYIPAQTSFVDSPTRAVHGFISKDADSIKEEVEKVKVTESKTTVVKGKEVTKQVTKTESRPTGNYFDAKSLRSVFFPKQQAGVNETALVVEMWYHRGSRFYRVLKEEKVGARMQYVPLLEGNQSFKMTDYEYDLYQRAKRMYPDCPSAGSDLMRFGRVIGVDAAAGQADCWLAMPFGASKDQLGYIDLAQAKVLKYSDADFPHFKGWARLKESAAHASDGTVDVQILSDLIAAADANKDGTTSPDELARYLKANPEMRRRLRYLICQAPSEWDDSYNAARYDGLQKPGKAFNNKQADYAEFKTFIQKFQFWGQAKAALAGHGVNSSTLWYFHPLQFVKQFRKANWLTLDEMVQLTPLVHLSREKATDIGVEVDTLYQPMRTRLVDGNNKGKSENFRQWVPAAVWRNINWICVKYGIDTQQRKAHFWAQIMQETGVVQDVTENGDDDYLLGLGYAHKNGNKSDEDAVNFRGRGLIQITGREKYEEYSKFRRTKDYALVPNNELIATNAFETCDSAGWYYSYYRPRTCQAGDAGITPSNVEAVTRAVNGGINHLPNRQTFFTHALCALGDQVGKFPAEYSPLNQDASDEFEKKKAEAALNATKKNKSKK